MKPTWEGWPDVIAAQNADVESTSPCLYVGQWNHDYRTWIPEVYDAGTPWDECTNIVEADAELSMVNTITSTEEDFWKPKGQENTTWRPVQFPK